MRMLPKPAHLAPEFASQFRDPSVIAAYHHRRPYPLQVIDHVLALRVVPRTVLDRLNGGEGQNAGDDGDYAVLASGLHRRLRWERMPAMDTEEGDGRRR